MKQYILLFFFHPLFLNATSSFKVFDIFNNKINRNECGQHFQYSILTNPASNCLKLKLKVTPWTRKRIQKTINQKGLLTDEIDRYYNLKGNKLSDTLKSANEIQNTYNKYSNIIAIRTMHKHEIACKKFCSKGCSNYSEKNTFFLFSFSKINYNALHHLFTLKIKRNDNNNVLLVLYLNNEGKKRIKKLIKKTETTHSFYTVKKTEGSPTGDIFTTFNMLYEKNKLSLEKRQDRLLATLLSSKIENSRKKNILPALGYHIFSHE